MISIKPQEHSILEHNNINKVWSDGSYFEGNIKDSKRNGYGTYMWLNGDWCCGNWYEDYRHGLCEYRWKCGHFYRGMFFKDKREGYGILRYENGNVFKGLFKNDKRFGPGILNYTNCTQDTGYWDGEKLVRILASVNCYIEFPKTLDPYRQVFIPSWYNNESILKSILNPKTIFLNKCQDTNIELLLDKNFLETCVTKATHYIDEYVKCLEIEKNELKISQMVSVTNLSPGLLSMFKHEYKHKVFLNFAQKEFNFTQEEFVSKHEPGLIESSSMEFLKAAYNGELEKVKLLKNYVNIDVCDSKGYTALMLASMRGHISIVNYLLDNGSNVNHLNDSGLSALILCINQRYSFKNYIPQNLVLQHRDPDLSIKTRNNKMAKISRKIQTIVEESEDDIELQSDLFKLLLQRGADPTIQLVVFPALAYVISHGDIEIAKLLIEKGINLHFRLPIAQNPTPLCLATGILEDNCVEMVEFLLRNKANPNEFATRGDEFTSLIVKGLEAEIICSDAKITETGRTPLHIACTRKDSSSIKIVKLLLENSANPNLVCNGQSPLSLAISVGNKEVIDVLLNNKECNVNQVLPCGLGNALTIACSTLFENMWPLNDKIELIEKLVAHGADLLVPIIYGSKDTLGNIIDYVYSSYISEKKQLVRRLNSAKLTIDPEKERAKNKFQAFLAKLFREKALRYLNNSGQTINKDEDDINLNSIESPVKQLKSKFDLMIKKYQWCLNCCRSVDVRLINCANCKKYYFCSNECRQKAWFEFHKNECDIKYSEKNLNKSILKKL